MTCEPLPNTGLDAPVLMVLTIGLLLVLVGVWSLLRARRFRGGAATTLLLVIVAAGGGIALGMAPASPALAAPSDCIGSSADNSLTITQTSVMDNLAPGREPAAISGVVVNNGPDSTFVTAITVEITAVVKRSGSFAGRCDASDYVLLDTRMPVGLTLAAYGGSADFSGAAIGFNNKSSNQDACQGATLELLYRTVPA